MKKSILILASTLSVIQVYASDSETASKEWSDIENVLIKDVIVNGVKPKNIEIPFGSNGSIFSPRNICFDNKGKEIESTSCDDLKIFFERIDAKDIVDSSECFSTVYPPRMQSCLNSYEQSNTKALLEKRIVGFEKDIAPILDRTVPKFKSKYGERLKSNLDKFEANLKRLKNPNSAEATAMRSKAEKILTDKLNSKECQIHQLEVELCRTTIVEDEMNAAMENEKEITNESGIVNKSRRYAIAANKQFHGTKKIPALKQKYKSLGGKEFSQSVCDGDGDPADEEIEKCGCTTDLSRSNQCP